ncbi:hypothetical protein OAS86_06260 [Gammaproteobacteria bacterium]|nr:hypothetical protein [Gammaproteobacteria bacterium]
MGKKSLIVVHGMGTHTDEESVIKEVTDALDIVFSRYPSLSATSPADEIDISAFAYDHYFENYKKAVADRNDIVKALLSVSSKSGGLLPEAVDKIDMIDKSIINDNMFSTHWLDVILYRYSLWAEPIQLALAAKIAAEVINKGGSNVHVMGVSLGSSLLHDSLVRLYGPQPTERKLSTVHDKIGCVHMVANVSRLLQTFSKVGASEVRPVLGCCTNFIQYRHQLDPIPQVKPFSPTNNGGWVTHRIWEENYRLIEPSAVTSANVHALGHYLLDPEVHLPFLRTLIGRRRFNPLMAERKAAKQAFDDTTLKGTAEALQQSIETLDFSKPSLNSFLQAAKTLKDVVESFGERF